MIAHMVIFILTRPVGSRCSRSSFLFKQRLHRLAAFGIVNKVCPEIITIIIKTIITIIISISIITIINIITINIIVITIINMMIINKLNLGIFPSVLALSSRRASLSSSAMFWLCNVSINRATWLKQSIFNIQCNIFLF